MIYFCCDQRRRKDLQARNRQVAAALRLNGIDCLEVLDHEAPPVIQRQQTLLVRLFEPVPAFKGENVRLTGGERITPVRVEWAYPAPAVPASVAPTNAERNYYKNLPEADHVLVVRTDSSGDFSTYRLTLVDTQGNGAPPVQFDPLFVAVDFSFKVECPTDFDCAPRHLCLPEATPEPQIDYLAKDYASFRRLVLDRMALLMPEWRERNPADLGIALVELLAYVGDHLSYRQDAVTTEAYLGTARRRISVRRHARLVDYVMHDGCNARTWVQVQCAAGTSGVWLPEATTLLTKVPQAATTIAAGSRELAEALQHQPVVFQTMHDLMLEDAHNEMHFHTWGDGDCCLPRGATRATLRGHFPNLRADDVLILEEMLGPQTGAVEDADSTRRQAVRLVAVQCWATAGTTPLQDPLNGQEITEILWSAEDALRFAFSVSSVTDPDHGSLAIRDVSVARGNIVAADHGRWLDQVEELGTVPAPSLRRIPDPRANPCDDRGPGWVAPRYNPVLREAPLTFAVPLRSANRFSFDLHGDIVAKLNQATVSPALTGEFRRAGMELAGVNSVQGGNGLWSISSGTQPWVIRQVGGRVTVSDPSDSAWRAMKQQPAEALPALRLASELRLFKLNFSFALATQLNAGLLTPALTQMFVHAGVVFPCPVSIQRGPGDGGPWVLRNGEEVYYLRNEATGLNVYELLDWAPRRDLLGSDAGDRDFVVEVESDGTAALRFGDGTHGIRPDSGTEFEARYRVGMGVAGNVGSETICHVVDSVGGLPVVKVRNPLPAVGGSDPEGMEDVRQRAPSAFRVKQRAVTAEDYAEMTERDPGVQRAAATFRWTGSWHTVFVTADRIGGLPVDKAFKKRTADGLEKYRMAGHDLEVDRPRYVSLEIALHVCVKPDYFRSQVRRALLEVFSNRVLPYGRLGIFHPDNFTFGQPVYLSRLYAVAQAVPGVASVHAELFRRQGQDETSGIDSGRLEFDRLEIARCDNDRNFSEHGVFQLTLGGGK